MTSTRANRPLSPFGTSRLHRRLPRGHAHGHAAHVGRRTPHAVAPPTPFAGTLAVAPPARAQRRLASAPPAPAIKTIARHCAGQLRRTTKCVPACESFSGHVGADGVPQRRAAAVARRTQRLRGRSRRLLTRQLPPLRLAEAGVATGCPVKCMRPPESRALCSTHGCSIAACRAVPQPTSSRTTRRQHQRRRAPRSHTCEGGSLPRRRPARAQRAVAPPASHALPPAPVTGVAMPPPAPCAGRRCRQPP